MVDYKELAKRLSTSARDVPNTEDNAKRVWEIWTQTAMFDPKDRFYNFSLYSGLPDGIIGKYIEVCTQFEIDTSYTSKPAKQTTN